MLAKRVEQLPDGEGWIFEPKWDGFRALVFRDVSEVFLQSRDAKPLARYYPELLAPLKAHALGRRHGQARLVAKRRCPERARPGRIRGRGASLTAVTTSRASTAITLVGSSLGQERIRRRSLGFARL